MCLYLVLALSMKIEDEKVGRVKRLKRMECLIWGYVVRVDSDEVGQSADVLGVNEWEEFGYGVS